MRAKRAVLAALCAALASAGVAVAVVPPAAAAAAPRDQVPAAERAALNQARTAGTAVVVAGQTTETQQVLANPDGTFTAHLASRPVRAQRPDGSWVGVDPSLARAADGSVAPVAVPMDLRLSGGGTGPLVSMARVGRSIALSWPDALPAPVLSGDTATYADVRPGVDLAVRSTVDGFSDVLVVRTEAAAASLDPVHFGLITAGVTVQAGRSGELAAVDAAGAVVFSAPPAQMWDSTTGGRPDRRAGAAASDARGPGTAARRGLLGTRLSAGGLDLVPDKAVLAGARYPVYLDPEITFDYSAWTETNQLAPGSVWRTADNLPAAGHAYDQFGTYTVRSYYQFGTAPIRGAHIFSARMRTFLIHSWSCQPRPVELWRMPSGFSGSTTWNNQPSLHGAQWQDTLNVAKGYSGCAAGMIGFDATKGAAAVAAAQATGITFGLKAANEGDVYAWKKFDVSNAQTIPQLDVEYDFAPNPLAARDLSTQQPATQCVGSASTPRINVPTTGMTLRARATDPDGSANKIRVNFEWKAASGTTVAGHATSPQGSSGATFTTTLSRGTLPADGLYAWHANVQDIDPDTGAVMLTTAWSPWCFFTLDTVRPNAPDVESDMYPGGDPAESNWPQPGIGAPLDVQLDANGSPDVVRFVWSLNQDRGLSGTSLPKIPNTSIAQMQVVPQRPGLNKLFVRSVDAAGNTQTQSVAFEFNVPFVTPSEDEILSFEGNVDDAADPGAAPVVATGNISYVPGKYGQAVQLDGSTSRIETRSCLLTSALAFTASAWVRLDTTTTTMTAVSAGSIDAWGPPVESMFDLSYRADTHKFVFNVASDTGPVSTASVQTPVAGAWYQLTGIWDSSTSTAKLLVNGQVEATASRNAETFAGFLGGCMVGHLVSAAGPAQRWKGAVDELHVWNRLMFPSEVGLIGQWSLDGSGLDDAPAGRNLTLGPDATYGTDRFGLPSSALSLHGTANGYAATAAAVIRTNASYTVSAWVQLSSKSTVGIAVSQFGNRYSPFYLQYRSDLDRWVVDLPSADSDTASVTRLQSAASPPLNTWTHLVLVIDASAKKARLYVGTAASIPVLQQEASFTTAWYTAGFTFNVGRFKIKGAPANPWNGSVDDITVYGDALNDYEITQLS